MYFNCLTGSGAHSPLCTVVGFFSHVSKAAASQAEAVNNGIYTIATLIPAILYGIVGLALVFIYNLDKAKVLENVEILKKRKAGEKNEK